MPPDCIDLNVVGEKISGGHAPGPPHCPSFRGFHFGQFTCLKDTDAYNSMCVCVCIYPSVCVCGVRVCMNGTVCVCDVSIYATVYVCDARVTVKVCQHHITVLLHIFGSTVVSLHYLGHCV